MGKTYRRSNVDRDGRWDAKDKIKLGKADAVFYGDSGSRRDTSLAKETLNRNLRKTKREDIHKALMGEDFVEASPKQIKTKTISNYWIDEY